MSARAESGLRTRRTPVTRFGFVATGPGFYVWEETHDDALRTARDLTRGAPVRVVRAGSRPLRASMRRR